MEKFKDLSLTFKVRQLAFLEDMTNYFTSENRCAAEDHNYCYYHPSRTYNTTNG